MVRSAAGLGVCVCAGVCVRGCVCVFWGRNTRLFIAMIVIIWLRFFSRWLPISPLSISLSVGFCFLGERRALSAPSRLASLQQLLPSKAGRMDSALSSTAKKLEPRFLAWQVRRLIDAPCPLFASHGASIKMAGIKLEPRFLVWQNGSLFVFSLVKDKAKRSVTPTTHAGILGQSSPACRGFRS
eukprot:COSAG01_NODE_2168_length_8243_cov_2.796442_7_plen_184_part_00